VKLEGVAEREVLILGSKNAHQIARQIAHGQFVMCLVPVLARSVTL
jgi:hypothetical protein